MLGIDHVKLHSPSDSNGKGSLAPVPPLDDGHLSSHVASRAREDLVRMPMIDWSSIVRVMIVYAVMRMGHGDS